MSYKTENRSIALKLRDKLVALNFQIWIDMFDIPKGAYWPDEIDKALRNSDVVIGILSPQSVESRNVKNEWDWAILNKRKLILLMVEKCYVPMNYVSINYVDFTNDFDTGFSQLLDALGAGVDKMNSSTSSTTVPNSPSLDTLFEKLVPDDDSPQPTFAAKIVKSERQTVSVDIVILSTGDRYTVELPLDSLVNLVIRELVKQIRLPQTFDNGAQVIYDLYSKTHGKKLDGSLTFRQNDVKDNDTLSFHITMVAG